MWRLIKSCIQTPRLHEHGGSSRPVTRIKRLGALLLLPGWDSSPSRGLPFPLPTPLPTKILPPLSPNSDENEISPHMIIACSNIQVMKIKETITKVKTS